MDTIFGVVVGDWNFLMARRRFKDLAAAKQAREAEALAQCEAAVRQLTEQLRLFTRLLVADLGALK